MRNTDLDARIEDCVQSFAADISKLIKRSVLESAREALGHSAAPAIIAGSTPPLRQVTLAPKPPPRELTPFAAPRAVRASSAMTPAEVPLSLDEYERHAFLRALHENGGVVPAAADALGLKKSAMYRRMAAMGIPRAHGRDAAAEAPGGYLKLDGPVSLEAYERAVLQRALGETDENLVDAAKLLGIGKSTMYRRCRAVGIK